MAEGPQSRSPFVRRYAWGQLRPLDWEGVEAATDRLLGTHDFRRFAKGDGGPTDGRTGLCTIAEARWDPTPEGRVLSITADRFLRHMVRAVVAALVASSLLARSAGSGDSGPGDGGGATAPTTTGEPATRAEVEAMGPEETGAFSGIDPKTGERVMVVKDRGGKAQTCDAACIDKLPTDAGGTKRYGTAGGAQATCLASSALAAHREDVRRTAGHDEVHPTQVGGRLGHVHQGDGHHLGDTLGHSQGHLLRVAEHRLVDHERAHGAPPIGEDRTPPPSSLARQPADQ